jgi:hypothetical protein
VLSAVLTRSLKAPSMLKARIGKATFTTALAPPSGVANAVASSHL